MGKKKEVFITENFSYLSVSDQVVFNDSKMQLKDAVAYCKGVFAGGFIFGMIYNIIRTSATKSLGPGVVKSVVFGFAMTGGFYQYNYWEYQKCLHKIYVRILNNRRALNPKKVIEEIKISNNDEKWRIWTKLQIIKKKEFFFIFFHIIFIQYLRFHFEF